MRTAFFIIVFFIAYALIVTGCGPQGSRGLQGPPGADGQPGAQGEQGEPGEDAKVTVIDPCGDLPRHIDQVLIRISPLVILSVESSRGNTNLVQLELDKRYVTSDRQRCEFKIDSDGIVYDENGGIF